MSYAADRPPFQPWDDRTLDPLLTTEDVAERAKAFVWTERRLASLMTTFAGAASEPLLSEVFTRQAAHHVWHAKVWEDELGAPSGVGDTPPTLTGHLPAVFDQVAGAKDSLEQLGALSRVLLPRLVAAYVYHRAASGSDLAPESDRWFSIVLADDHDDRRELEMLVQALLGAPADAERLAAWQSQLESMLVKAGGLFGPGTLGGQPATSTGG
ncbi:MAG: hypothetical protein LC792_10015 [Actinobacteria bacterium]|nr:hypothetical protein [Actinomycetota bacterium]